MKKTIIGLLFFTLLISCGNSISDNDLAKLNGYWEIEKATLPDGTVNEYSINPTIDFFELKDTVGIRKKVMPQLDGTYLVNNTSEKISISKTKNKVYINYTTEYAKWEEEIIELGDKKLILKNSHDIEYQYKKPELFTVK